MQNIQFIEMTENDLQVVKNIYDHYILNTTATFHINPITINELKEFIFVSHPVYKSYIIQFQNITCGYCFLTQYKKRPAYNRTAEITVYLKPGMTGKGIGSETLRFLEKKAKQVGIKNIVGIITGENDGSIRLFEKSGYQKCAHFKNIGEKFGRILDVVAYQKEIE